MSAHQEVLLSVDTAGACTQPTRLRPCGACCEAAGNSSRGRREPRATAPATAPASLSGSRTPAATEVTVSQERLSRAAPSSAGPGSLQPLLTDRDVAAVLAVRPDTVRRWAACGVLPSVRLGGRLLRFRAEDVQQWIQGQASPGQSPPSRRRRSGSIRSTG